MDWFATHSAGILRGSLSNADDKVQLIWIKFMAMANEAKDPISGRLEFAKGQPYPLDYIAAICRKPVEDIKEAINEFKNDISKDHITPRIIVENDGTIVLSNWSRYQPKDRGKLRPTVDKETGEIKITLTPLDNEHKEKQNQVIAYKMAQKYPEDAKAGLTAAKFETHIKDKVKKRRVIPNRIRI